MIQRKEGKNIFENITNEDAEWYNSKIIEANRKIYSLDINYLCKLPEENITPVLKMAVEFLKTR